MSAKNKLDYEIEWFGMPVIQTAEDMIMAQELIFKIQPDYIIETGIAHGGSLIYYASLFELMGKGTVIGVDIEIREHNKKVIKAHPFFKRVHLIEGDSSSLNTIEKVSEIVKEGSRTIVCLDSNHYKEHVLKELEVYSKFISKGGYFVVYDTVTSRMAQYGCCDKSFMNNGPMEAVEEFIKGNKDFVIDKKFNKLCISTSNNGFLERVR